MKKTSKLKIFLGALMLSFSLLLTGCPQAAENTAENPVENPDNILSNPDWTITNAAAISYDNSSGVYTIDCKPTTGGFSTIYTSSEPITLTFKIKTHMGDWDGCMQFLIDDEIVEQYNYSFGLWQSQQIDIGAGTHKFEWKHQDNDLVSWTVWNNNPAPFNTPFVCIKDIEFKDKNNAIRTINKSSENPVNSDTWIATGICAEVVDKDIVLTKFPQYGDALVDTHKKALKLSTCVKDNSGDISGNSSLIIKDILVSEDSALSFDYKCDLLDWTDDKGVYHRNFFKVFIDDDVVPSFFAYGSGQMWQNASVILSAGKHTVKFVSGTNDYWYANDLTNATYLDNITLAPNRIASVDIYPKGLQETYVNGDTIQFSAKALRADGSVIPDKDITWHAVGGSIDDAGLFTPGLSAGTFTVTAKIDGLSASNETVKIHDSNYLSDSVTINGHTFTGNITYNTEQLPRSETNNITFSDPTPKYITFTTDGFFVLKGHADEATNTHVLVAVLKDDGDDSTYNELEEDYPYQTDYIFKPGDFESRIWLRFGDGKYQIFVAEASAQFYEDYDGYEGALKHWDLKGGLANTDLYTQFVVTNQTGLNYTAEDCAYLMPSAYCQSDDFIISNAFNGIMAELPSDATLGQKLQALYDWEARRSHYDYVSFTTESTTKRKRQDAVHVLKYGMAVCEGYADLYTAFARLLGVKSAFQYSPTLNHDWTELYYKGAWKMVDITWDDSYGDNDAENVEKMPTAERYWYFLVDTIEANHKPNDNITEIYRSASPVVRGSGHDSSLSVDFMID